MKLSPLLVIVATASLTVASCGARELKQSRHLTQDLSSCSGSLPGNCPYQEGIGYFHCNDPSLCDMGANDCRSFEECTDTCNRAEEMGGACYRSQIPWELDCDGARVEVSVTKHDIITSTGTVVCDDSVTNARRI